MCAGREEINAERSGYIEMETISNTKLKIKTWWDLRHGTASIMEIYALICSEAMGYHENSQNRKDFTVAERHVQEAIAGKLYQIAAALENTEEINPAKE